MSEVKESNLSSGVTPCPDVVIPNEEKDICITDDTLTTDLASKEGSCQSSSSVVEEKENKSKKSSGLADVSKEKQPKKTKSRVVQSRFRSGLNNSNNNSNNSNSKSNNGSSNSLNCTISGSSSSSSNSFGSKSKNLRVPSAAKSGIGRSVNNVSKAPGLMGRSNGNLANYARPTKSNINLSETKSTFGGRTRTNVGNATGRSKLHSTVLAERTMLSSTHNLFSTTLVGGVEPGRKILFGEKPHGSVAILPELPDISAIKMDSLSSDKSVDNTILSVISEKDSSQEISSEMLKEVTQEDLNREYLRYLQSYYMSTVSEEAFDNQLDQLKTQLVYLDILTNEKQAEVTERKQKLELLEHHRNACDGYDDQTKLLQNLIDVVPESEEALEVLTKESEKNLHQIKMDNLYIPDNHKMYRDELSMALTNQIDCLDTLEQCLVQPQSYQLDSTIGMLDDLLTSSQRVQQHDREVNQAARLAIQNASLQIVAQQDQ